MLELFIGAICFSAGFYAGAYFKTAVFGSQDWKVMKWNPDIFGYRKVPPGHSIYKDDDVFMCLKMDTDDIHSDGEEVHGEDW